MRFSNDFLTRMRSSAQSLMTDTCTVKRATGELSVDPETGVSTPLQSLVYEGACKVQTYGGVASESSVSGSQGTLGTKVAQWSLTVHFPYATPGLQSGDIVEIHQSQNTALTNRKLRLINLQSEKTHATALRWNVKEITSEEDS